MNLEVIKNIITEAMPTAGVYVRHGAVGGEKTATVVVTVGRSKDDYINNISQNDPLNLGMYIEENELGYLVEFNRKSLTINPQNQYYAYGSHKIALRKFNAKDDKELAKKLTNALKKVKTAIKDQLDSGNFSVYEGYPVVIERLKEASES